MIARYLRAYKWPLLALVVVSVALLAIGGGESAPAVVMLAALAGLLWAIVRFSTGPLSVLIARIRYSIRWKIAVVISIMALLFLLVSLINFSAMGHMHDRVHEIQDLMLSQPFMAHAALDALHNTQHGLLFSLTPMMASLAGLVALGLGMAIAWSVIEPVRRMGEAMRRIASGDLSQTVRVENRDELGELASRINQTAKELSRLQETTLAEERARALRERIAQVTLAQEEERRRISRELHDNLGPSLAAIGNRLMACKHMVHTDPQRAEEELEEAARMLRGHVQEVRELIHDLRPLSLDQLGLSQSVAQQIDRFSQETGAQVTFSLPEDLVLDPLSEISVFRVIQECLNNIQKHAVASHVDIRLEKTASGMQLWVEDNGRGFDTRGVEVASEKGLGLLSMQERADLVGGTLSVGSSPGRGTRVVLSMPLAEVRVGASARSAGR